MPNDIEVIDRWSEGRLQLIVGLCEKMGVTEVFNKHLEKTMGRPSDIPAGIEAEIMIAGICCDEGYSGLYAINEYYQYKDLEGIFHHPMELSQLNDDRFGNFLDAFYDAGCRNIFREISGRAFTEYGLKVKNINYDTTSKVMWGAYEYTNNSSDSNDDISYISIDFGHSKDKRDDKKQIKIGLGTTNGVVTDAKVLSGNMDDKTYNKENLEDVDELLTQMKVDRNEFYYIADSALFTTKNIEKANEHHIKFITRMPDNIKVAKKFLDTPLPNDAQSITIKNAHDEEIVYKLIDTQEEYMKGIPVNLLLSILPHWKRPSGRLALRKLKKRKSKFKRH